VAAASRGLDAGGGLMGAAAPYSQGLDLAAVLVAGGPVATTGSHRARAATAASRGLNGGGGLARAAALSSLGPRSGGGGGASPPPLFGFLKIVTSVVPTKDTYLPSVADETYISLIYILLSARDR
jgi:hypothetical protein